MASEHVDRIPVVLYTGEDGQTVAECTLIPGCISQGRTRDEAIANIREAIALCIANRDSEGWALPDRFEVVEPELTAK